MISDLQEELVKVRLRDAENEAAIRDLKDKIGELEHVSKILLCDTEPILNKYFTYFTGQENSSRISCRQFSCTSSRRIDCCKIKRS